MSWPASAIVDAIFIPIYVALAIVSLFNVIFHGAGKTFGFIYLLIFSIVRLVANILLVYSYNTHDKNEDVLEWGFILQGIGYSFLISASLAFLSRASKDDKSNNNNVSWSNQIVSNLSVAGQNGNGSKKFTLGRILYLANLIALILLITGYTDTTDLFPTSTAGVSSQGGQLDSKAKIGEVIFLILTVVIALLSIVKLPATIRKTEPRVVLSFMLAALVPMLIRIAYVTYQSFTQHPLQRRLAVKVVLEYIMEVLAVSIYGTMGLLLRKFVNTEPDIEVHAMPQEGTEYSK